MVLTDDSATATLSVASEILRILGTIGKTGRALWPIALLIARFPATEAEAVLDAAAELEHEGRIVTWAEAKGGPAVMLSPWEAWNQGIELDDSSRRWRRRRVSPGNWTTLYDNHQRPIRIKRLVIETVAHVEDRTRFVGDGPLPTVLLGERLMWNGPEQMHQRRYQVLTKCYVDCVGCLDRPKSSDRYCLCCDNRLPKERKKRR